MSNAEQILMTEFNFSPKMAFKFTDSIKLRAEGKRLAKECGGEYWYYDPILVKMLNPHHTDEDFENLRRKYYPNGVLQPVKIMSPERRA